MTTITLTDDQQKALDAFKQFMLDPIETVFVLAGYSGTGKSTLVKTMLDQLPGLLKTAKLITPDYPDYSIELTATTNKAAESLTQLSDYPVSTIHSFLGLRVQTDYETGQTKLIPKDGHVQESVILYIDEGSYVDSYLLRYIFSRTRNCKIIFIGDPAQLTPVKSSGTPVFNSNFAGAHLSQVVRQAEGNPIIDLSTKFRITVTSGEFFSFQPDGHHVVYLAREDFNKAIEQEFARPDWKYQDSKILGWTNKCVIGYNHMVRDMVKGSPHFQVGDYAVVNKFVTAKPYALKTDQLVRITRISEDETRHGVLGNVYTLDGHTHLFAPKSLQEKNALIKQARAKNQYNVVAEAEDRWVDLRAAYACTINKAQGSTYDRVFIDLDDIKRCTSGEQIARMMYVAVSRARQQVFLTGDLV